MFEQVEDGFIFWEKGANKKMDAEPNHDFVPLPDCPWKLAATLEDYKNDEDLWLEVHTFILDHVFLPDERLYDVLTAWVLATWLPEQWDVIPYLCVKGPMGSGKTRLLETLEAIAYRGIFSANMTSAALFRLSELYRPTIFLDETEIYTKEQYSDVIHLLNAGYRRGQKAWRVEHGKDGMPYVKGYDVFGMKALSGIEKLADTLQSRSIVIDMVKTVKRVNFRVNLARAQALRNRLLQYRFHKLSQHFNVKNGNCEDVKQSEHLGKIHPLIELNDGRLLELFDCLIHVANSGLENIVSYAKTMSEIREAEEQATVQCQVLEAMLTCSPDLEGIILTKTIKDALNQDLNDKDKFSTRYVSRILGNLGLKRVHTRKGNGFRWDKRMIEYRAKQYHIEKEDAISPPVSSLSFTSSQNDKSDIGTPMFESCYFCQKPIWTEDWKTGELSAQKPAHRECYDQQEAMTKKPEAPQ